MKRWILLLAIPTLAAEIRVGRFHNRDAWVIESPQLRVSITQSGGHIAEIVLKDAGAVNPLWVQTRPTIDAEQYVKVKHEKFYGGGAGARLMSGLLGHNICFPYWGDPSPAEFAAGMTYHGETGVSRWKRSGGGETLAIAADLPESKTRFSRLVRSAGQIVYFESTAENLAAWDRPVGWCEHVTIGPPFLEKGVTVTSASLTRGRASGDTSGAEFSWPSGRAESAIDLRVVRNIPKSAFVNNFLVDPSREYGYFAAVHPKYRLVFGYVFRRAEFPWLNIWEANNPEMLTRGMEFSNTPVHGTFKALVKSASLFGVPTYEWLDGKSRITKRFAAFVARTPDGYSGVADVRVNPGKLEIIEHERGRIIELEFGGLR